MGAGNSGPCVPDVADDADDRVIDNELHVLLGVWYVYALPECILPRPVLPRRLLVDDDDASRVGAVIH